MTALPWRMDDWDAVYRALEWLRSQPTAPQAALPPEVAALVERAREVAAA